MDTPETKVFKISKEDCQKMIHGVCNRCGGELEPIETVDNSGDPTYWGACMSCQIYHWGTPKEVFDMAVILYDQRGYTHYKHLDRPDPKDEPSMKYFRESQIAGACSIIYDVLYAQKVVNEKK